MTYYGELTLFVGPMFARKTNSLIKEILYHSYFEAGEGAVIYKLGFDTRFYQDRVTSHDGLMVDATVITSAAEIAPGAARNIFFDEIQFFTDPHFKGNVVDRIRQLRADGHDVFAAGLDMDYLGHGFEVTAHLMAEATNIHRLTARCSVCGGPATHTSVKIPLAGRFEIGGEKTYSPMCAAHWFAASETGYMEDKDQ